MKKNTIPVVFIITKLELGGAQKVCLALFSELKKNNIDTWLISGTEGPLVKQVLHNKQAIFIPELKRECSFFGIKNDIKAIFTLYKTLKTLQKKYNTRDLIIHTHSTKAGYLGRWAAFFARITHRIHTVHGFGFHPYQSRLGYAFAYVLEFLTSWITSSYICVSKQDQKIGTRLLPGFSKKNILIRAAVQDKAFNNQQTTLRKKNTDHFIFGTVSCFKKQKNLFDVLEAFLVVHQKHSHARLEIIGDGLLKPNIIAWIHQHNLNDYITLHGWVHNVAPLMQHWNVFVMSSLWEGLPCAAVEARFLKLPVLAYNVGGLSELIQSHKNGFLYEPRNILDLRNGMISLLTDKVLYKKLKEHTEDLSSFTINAMLVQHNLLYRSMIKK